MLQLTALHCMLHTRNPKQCRHRQFTCFRVHKLDDRHACTGDCKHLQHPCLLQLLAQMADNFTCNKKVAGKKVTV